METGNLSTRRAVLQMEYPESRGRKNIGTSAASERTNLLRTRDYGLVMNFHERVRSAALRAAKTIRAGAERRKNFAWRAPRGNPNVYVHKR